MNMQQSFRSDVVDDESRIVGVGFSLEVDKFQRWLVFGIQTISNTI